MTAGPRWRRLLEFEADNRSPVDRGAKARVIREVFGVSTGRYWLEIYQAIDRPDVLKAFPVLVMTLRHERDQNRVRRSLQEPVTSPARQSSLFDTDRPGPSPEREAAREAAPGRSVSDGEARKRAGMAIADAAADEAWKARVDQAILALGAKGEPFTSEDVREIAGDPPGHPNAMGSRFNQAARRREIVRVGYRLATRATLHRHPLALWVGATADSGEGVA